MASHRRKHAPSAARFAALAAAVLLAAADSAPARVKLVTLPERERVELRLDHDARVLVEEERVVPLVAGHNQVDFAWSQVPVDPHAIVLRVLGPDPDRVQVLSVSHPPGENALVGTLHAAAAGPARVRISYLIGGITRTFAYRAVADREERFLTLDQFLRVRNLANEDFGASGVWLGSGRRVHRPVGLDETSELLVERFEAVPIRKTYTAEAAAFGWEDPAAGKLRVAMHYVLANRAHDAVRRPVRRADSAPAEHARAHRAADGTLGLRALPSGKVRIFQRDASGGMAFLGEDWGRAAPPGQEMPLYLGLARDVSVRRVVESSERERVAGDLFHLSVVIRYEIENFKREPVRLRLAESIPGILLGLGLSGQGAAGTETPQWRVGAGTTFAGGPDPEETTAERILVSAALDAAPAGGGAKHVHRLHLEVRNQW